MSNRRNVFLKASFVLPQWKKKAEGVCCKAEGVCGVPEGVCDAGGSVCETHTPECNTHSRGHATHSRGLAVHTPEFYFWHYGRTKLGHSKKRWATIWHYWSVVYFTESYLHTRISFHSLSLSPTPSCLTCLLYFLPRTLFLCQLASLSSPASFLAPSLAHLLYFSVKLFKSTIF